MVLTYGKTTILNVNPDSFPYGLKIGFSVDLDLYDQEKVEAILEYWLRSSAIACGKYELKWKDEKTVIVSASFELGNFKGDLTHHNALTSGDDQFKIGLCKLFYQGYTPKTKSGRLVVKAPLPVYIKCLGTTDIESENGSATYIFIFTEKVVIQA